MLEIKRTKFEKQDKRPLWISAPFQLTGTLRNYDGNGNENVKKAIGLMNKTTTLNVHHAFLLSVDNYDVNWQILSFPENGNGKAINSIISVGIRARSPLFSSNQNSLLLSNRANWIIAKKFKRMWRLFFRDVFIDVAVFAITQSFYSCRGKSNKKPRAVIQAFTVFNNVTLHGTSVMFLFKLVTFKSKCHKKSALFLLAF